MTEVRDYVAWHAEYDDPESGLAQRLRRVREHLRDVLDERGTDPVTVLSVCAGDGRDILGVLAERPDSGRVTGNLLEIDPTIATAARARIARDLLIGMEVVQGDAGQAEAYTGLVPVDLLLLVGVFGNVTAEDLERLIGFAPQLCRPGADVLWTCRASEPDRVAAVREWLRDAGFHEVACDTPRGSRSVIGRSRYTGGPVPLAAQGTLFTFVE